MDERLAPAPVVRRLVAAVDDLVVGLFVGGSVSTGDYRPTIRDGRLITKTEAITRLTELGLALEIVDGIVARRRGEHRPPLSAAETAQRARTVRRFMGHHIERLVQRGPGASGSAAAAPRLS